MGYRFSEWKQAARRLRRSPMFTFIAVLTLALGIGANTAIFSVLEGVLLKPLPYPDPDRLVGLWLTAPGINLPEINLSPSVYYTLADQNRTFENLGIYNNDGLSITGDGEPEQLSALDITEGVLPTLGVAPILGRNFTAKDTTEGQPETILLSYAYWQKHFHGDPSALGKRLIGDGKAREVIGILPRNFRFLDSDADVFVPFQFNRSKLTLGNFSQQGVARLKPGVTLTQANADVGRLLPVVNRSFPPPPGFSARLFEDAHIGPALRPFKKDLIGDVGNTLWVLMGTISIVLLIACANVANLLLVRVESRHLELTIRTALGASVGRIAYELLIESLILAACGGVAGLLLAYGALKALVLVAPAGLPRVNEIGMDAPVLVFAILISLLTGLLFGLAPVLKYAGLRIAAGLRDGGRSASLSRERHRARSLLVVAQVALALILLVCSGLMIRTFAALTQVQPGFQNAAHLQTLGLYIPPTQVAAAEKVLRMQQDLASQIRAVPGVTAVSMTAAVPMSDNNSFDVLFARDKNMRAGQIPPIRRFVFAAPGLHQTMGTKLLAGRDFTWNDTTKDARVAMVSESLARDFWGSPSAALHKQVREGMNDDWREVIGVVQDIHFAGLDQPAPATVYFPLFMDNFQGEKEALRRSFHFVVQSPRAGSESFMKEVREAIWKINPNLPLWQVHTLDHFYRRSMSRTSFTLVLLLIAATMALILGSIGVYGVLAYTISRRRREIGIRMALGAQTIEVAAMFVRHGMWLVGLGALIGTLSALGLTQLLSKLLFGVKPADPVTYVATLAFLLLTAFIASYLPSRRAALVDPATALHGD